MSDILDLFRETGALLQGHFILRSGLHSREFFQCALLLRQPRVAERVCGELAEKLRPFPCDTVISPAVGGIVVGQEVARVLDRPHIFAEKDDKGGLVLRRGFEIQPGERFVVAEDVVTLGGRLQQTIDIVRAHGGLVVAAGSIVDRSCGKLPDFGCPYFGLIQMFPETFTADQIPEDLRHIPAIKPGSK